MCVLCCGQSSGKRLHPNPFFALHDLLFLHSIFVVFALYSREDTGKIRLKDCNDDDDTTTNDNDNSSNNDNNNDNVDRKALW